MLYVTIESDKQNKTTDSNYQYTWKPMNLICVYCQYNKMDTFKYLLVLCIHSIVIAFQS